MSASGAGDIGRARGTAFREAVRALKRLTPPTACRACHVDVNKGLQNLIRACDVQAEIGRSGDLKHEGDAVALGRGPHARAGEHVEYARLCTALWTHVDAVRARQEARWAEARKKG